MTTTPPADDPQLVEPGPLTDWYTAVGLDGQSYRVRHHAPGLDSVTLAYLTVTEAQLNYVRAIHESGHAVAVLLGRGHLHSAEIVLGDADAETGGVVYACNMADGHGYAIYSAAGERAADRWLREAGLWTPEGAIANEVAAWSDREQFMAINPHVGFGDRQVDYRVVHDLADEALDQHWTAVVRVADQLVQRGHLDAEEIVAIAGLPNGAASAKCPIRPAGPCRTGAGP
ncbi:hypothetical protein ACH4MG_27190 [Streptomyces sp. NPDC017454]|uniref:hypothetical protein n=1 Tax=Streptomyces sp. NPDC017454 TaxID=3364997 RepID=UPI00378A0BC3